MFFTERNIIFDKRIKSVIIEKRRVIDKKIKWKEIEKIRFSDIEEVNVNVSIVEGEGGGTYYHIKLILVEGIRDIGVNGGSLWISGKSKIVSESAIKLCEIIGVKGYYIDEKNNSTPLWKEEKTSSPPQPSFTLELSELELRDGDVCLAYMGKIKLLAPHRDRKGGITHYDVECLKCGLKGEVINGVF
jgi:hypothetical protein